MFGEFIRNIRIKKELGLREFCLKYNHDPSNWSKIEREVLPPPDDESLLYEWATQLGLKEGSRDWFHFFDCAALDRGKIPHYIQKNEELLKELPVFFRTLSGNKPSKEELSNLLKILRHRNQP